MTPSQVLKPKWVWSSPKGFVVKVDSLAPCPVTDSVKSRAELGTLNFF